MREKFSEFIASIVVLEVKFLFPLRETLSDRQRKRQEHKACVKCLMTYIYKSYRERERHEYIFGIEVY